MNRKQRRAKAAVFRKRFNAINAECNKFLKFFKERIAYPEDIPLKMEVHSRPLQIDMARLAAGSLEDHEPDPGNLDYLFQYNTEYDLATATLEQLNPRLLNLEIHLYPAFNEEMLDVGSMLFTLAHECVHIQQLLDGRLVEMGGRRWWHGQECRNDRNSGHAAYDNQDWERDANLGAKQWIADFNTAFGTNFTYIQSV